MRIERFNLGDAQAVQSLGLQQALQSEGSTEPIGKQMLKRHENEAVSMLRIFVLQQGNWIEYKPDLTKNFFTIGSSEEDTIIISDEPEVQKQHIAARHLGKNWFIIERAEKSILQVNNIKKRHVTLNEQSSCILKFGSFTILMTTNIPGFRAKLDDPDKAFKVTNPDNSEYSFNISKTVLIGSNPLCDILTKGTPFEGLISSSSEMHFFYSLPDASFRTGENKSLIPMALPGQSRIAISSGIIKIEFPASQHPINRAYQIQTVSNPSYFILTEITGNETLGKKTILPPNGHSVAVGRGKDNYIVVDSSRISRHHAQIITSSINIILTDCDSTNGTFVNDEKIKRKIVMPGDIISFAGSDFILLYNEQ